MKSKSTTKPWKKAQPFILGAANQLQNTFNQQQPRLQEIASDVQGVLPTFRNRVQNGDPTLQAGRGYTEGVLGGRYLGEGNPYTSQIIDQNAGDITDRVNAIFGAAGRTGSGRHTQVVTQELADSANRLRYEDYARERSAMEAAAGRSGMYGQAENANLGAYLTAAQTAGELPFLGARMLGQGMGSLLGGYTTQVQRPALGPMLIQGASNAAQAYAGGGF